MDTCVIVPNWNGEDFIKACIDSLLQQTQSLTVIVVDNGSHDGSLALLKAYGQKITLLENEKNLGFAGGVNCGIRYALGKDYQYILLFNNDAVANKDWASQLVKTAAKNDRLGIVAPKILRMDSDVIDSTGDFYSVYGLPFPRGRDEHDTGQYDSSTTVFGASGGASLYKAALLKDIGMFDEDFFAYFEDVDISFRAQLSGWLIEYQPKAKVYHHVSATSSKLGDFNVYQTAKNFPMLAVKNLPTRLFFKYLPRYVYWYVRMFGARLLRGGGLAYAKGFFRALSLLPKKLLERRDIMKHRQVSTEYIDSILYHQRPPILGEPFQD